MSLHILYIKLQLAASPFTTVFSYLFNILLLFLFWLCGLWSHVTAAVRSIPFNIDRQYSNVCLQKSRHRKKDLLCDFTFVLIASDEWSRAGKLVQGWCLSKWKERFSMKCFPIILNEIPKRTWVKHVQIFFSQSSWKEINKQNTNEIGKGVGDPFGEGCSNYVFFPNRYGTARLSPNHATSLLLILFPAWYQLICLFSITFHVFQLSRFRRVFCKKNRINSCITKMISEWLLFMADIDLEQH